MEGKKKRGRQPGWRKPEEEKVEKKRANVYLPKELFEWLENQPDTKSKVVEDALLAYMTSKS